MTNLLHSGKQKSLRKQMNWQSWAENRTPKYTKDDWFNQNNCAGLSNGSSWHCDWRKVKTRKEKKQKLTKKTKKKKKITQSKLTGTIHLL